MVGSQSFTPELPIVDKIKDAKDVEISCSSMTLRLLQILEKTPSLMPDNLLFIKKWNY